MVSTQTIVGNVKLLHVIMIALAHFLHCEVIIFLISSQVGKNFVID